MFLNSGLNSNAQGADLDSEDSLHHVNDSRCVGRTFLALIQDELELVNHFIFFSSDNFPEKETIAISPEVLNKHTHYDSSD